MANSYTNCLYHIVFSTKKRQPLLTAEIRERLWPYLGGLARERRIIPLMIGGVADHVHLLLVIPTTLAPAKAIQEIKAFSSRWFHETFPELAGFAWQEGYGAFTIGESQKGQTINYIATQVEHHRKTTFEEEIVAFLKKNNINYDDRYLLG